MAGSSVSGELSGPRLEFVVRKLAGSVMRSIATWSEAEKKIVNIPKEVPAGYMVFLPNGQSYRLSEKELKRRGFDRPPNILGFEQANNDKTAAGRFKLAISEEARKKAYGDLEKEVVDVAMKKVGRMDNMLTDYNPTVVKEKAA